MEYRTHPDRVSELLPPPLEPAGEDPGAVALIWADWQSRRFPAVEPDGTASVEELVTMTGYDLETAGGWAGEADLSLFPSPAEERHRPGPAEIIAGYRRQAGMSRRGGTALHRSSSPHIGTGP